MLVAFLEKIEEYFMAETTRKQKMKEKRSSESNEGEDYKIDEIIKLLSSTCRTIVKNETSETANK